ncbi:MAG: Zinc transporter ZupT [Candidatus Moanabacter tarae]|uniref:Zinc transporter ZupT n=1 Tax=Candidatus Moanibacter tarae TaxID=2200854 RepID=A0A2Z4AD19_9BACT|nr:MAG: Zinc transporter ZupT [Candidatus Moanabacter tarae]
MLIVWILTFSLSGTIGTIVAASLFLTSQRKISRVTLSCFLSFAVGTLLSVAFLRLLPEALELAKSRSIMVTVLFGIVLFFVLEKLLIWRHCHEQECQVHATGGHLILLGDSFHNFVDGITIAAAFMTSIPLGATTALAIIIHEIPQEVADFSILLKQGFSAKKAILFNTLSSLTMCLGALIAYFALDLMNPLIPFILAISASSFIYVATVDLIANLHRDSEDQSPRLQLFFVFCGIATISILGGLHTH